MTPNIKNYVIPLQVGTLKMIIFLSPGFLVEFISAPVLHGFLSAAAISAMSSQVAPLLGIKGGGSTFVEYWVSVVKNIQGGIGVWDTVLGFSCIAALVLLQVRYTG